MHRGGVFEDPGLFYWHRINRGAQAEVDYLCEAGGFVIPIEVKSSASSHLRSMRLFLDAYPSTRIGIKISREPFRKQDTIVTIPLYAAERVSGIVEAML